MRTSVVLRVILVFFLALQFLCNADQLRATEKLKKSCDGTLLAAFASLGDPRERLAVWAELTPNYPLEISEEFITQYEAEFQKAKPNPGDAQSHILADMRATYKVFSSLDPSQQSSLYPHLERRLELIAVDDFPVSHAEMSQDLRSEILAITHKFMPFYANRYGMKIKREKVTWAAKGNSQRPVYRIVDPGSHPVAEDIKLYTNR